MNVDFNAWVPYIMVALGIGLAWLILSAVLKLARVVIGIGCGLIFIVVVIVLIINYL